MSYWDLSPEELELKKEYACSHFIERLQERYGIDITQEEYYELCEQPLQQIYSLTFAKRYGTIDIKGQQIPVIRDKKHQTLNTCVPSDGTLPMPVKYKKAGKQYEDFENDVQVMNERIDHLVDWLKNNYRLPEDQKRFFVEKPLDYRQYEYAAAWNRFNGKPERTYKLIRKLCEKTYTEWKR